MEKLFRSRAARVGFVVALVAISVWGFAPYLLGDVATSAYVNAELTRVTTPVAGVLTGHLPPEGSYLVRDEPLRLVTARTPDRTRLDDLERQAALAVTSVSLVEDQLGEIRRDDDALSRRSALFKASTLDHLGGQARQAQAELAGCGARLQQQQDAVGRSRRLADKGFLSNAGLHTAEAALDGAVEDCKAARAGLDAVQAEGKAAQRGVYIKDGANDAPYSEQQRGRLMLRRQDLMTELMRGRSMVSLTRAQLGQEQTRYANATSFDVVLPARRLIWNVAARQGSDVAEGQALVDLADCSHRFVVVELPTRKIERLAVGQAARIRLLGSDLWIEGRVRRITGGVARHDSRLLAADAPTPGPHSFTVEVLLPAQAAEHSRVDNRACDIGRMADVRFGGAFQGGQLLRLAAARLAVTN